MYSVCIFTRRPTLLKVVGYYDLSVLSMSVMGFQNKVWMGGQVGELYPSFFWIFGILLTLQSPFKGKRINLVKPFISDKMVFKHCDLRFFLCNNISRPKILTNKDSRHNQSSIVQYVYIVLSDFVQSSILI